MIYPEDKREGVGEREGGGERETERERKRITKNRFSFLRQSKESNSTPFVFRFEKRDDARIVTLIFIIQFINFNGIKI